MNPVKRMNPQSGSTCLDCIIHYEMLSSAPSWLLTTAHSLSARWMGLFPTASGKFPLALIYFAEPTNTIPSPEVCMIIGSLQSVFLWWCNSLQFHTTCNSALCIMQSSDIIIYRSNLQDVHTLLHPPFLNRIYPSIFTLASNIYMASWNAYCLQMHATQKGGNHVPSCLMPLLVQICVVSVHGRKHLYSSHCHMLCGCYYQ